VATRAVADDGPDQEAPEEVCSGGL